MIFRFWAWNWQFALHLVSTEGSAIFLGFLRLFSLRNPRIIADTAVCMYKRVVRNAQSSDRSPRKRSRFPFSCSNVQRFLNNRSLLLDSKIFALHSNKQVLSAMVMLNTKKNSTSLSALNWMTIIVIICTLYMNRIISSLKGYWIMRFMHLIMHRKVQIGQQADLLAMLKPVLVHVNLLLTS